MSRVTKQKQHLIERKNKQLLGKPEMECPEATQDLELNTKNRDAAINKYKNVINQIAKVKTP